MFQEVNLYSCIWGYSCSLTLTEEKHLQEIRGLEESNVADAICVLPFFVKMVHSLYRSCRLFLTSYILAATRRTLGSWGPSYQRCPGSYPTLQFISVDQCKGITGQFSWPLESRHYNLWTQSRLQSSLRVWAEDEILLKPHLCLASSLVLSCFLYPFKGLS